MKQICYRVGRLTGLTSETRAGVQPSRTNIVLSYLVKALCRCSLHWQEPCKMPQESGVRLPRWAAGGGGGAGSFDSQSHRFYQGQPIAHQRCQLCLKRGFHYIQARLCDLLMGWKWSSSGSRGSIARRASQFDRSLRGFARRHRLPHGLLGQRPRRGVELISITRFTEYSAEKLR